MCSRYKHHWDLITQMLSHLGRSMRSVEEALGKITSSFDWPLPLPRLLYSLIFPMLLACTCMGTLPRWERMWQYPIKLTSIQVDMVSSHWLPIMKSSHTCASMEHGEDRGVKEAWERRGPFEWRCDLAQGVKEDDLYFWIYYHVVIEAKWFKIGYWILR